MMRTIRDLDASGKRVLVRVDFNVPMRCGVVADDTRIRAALPTIKSLVDQGAKVILASHLGRPKGTVVEGLRMAPVATHLTRLLGRTVAFTSDCVGPEVARAVDRLEPGRILVLENVRFHPEEEANDPVFAAALAANADAFVNDAFGTAHRAHASTVGVAEVLPAYAGLLLEREVAVLSDLLEHPERPFVGVIGGAKVSDKLGVIEHLLTKVDALILGGGMANTFLSAEGFAIGTSLAEKSLVGEARRILASAARAGVPILLPLDVVVTDEVRHVERHRLVSVGDVGRRESIVDIGPASIRAITSQLEAARTIFWNGPLGVFEIEAFAAGTNAVARELATRARHGATVVAGGGESVAAISALGLASRMTHLSTGGGASLEFIEGKDLPGVSVLQERVLATA